MIDWKEQSDYWSKKIQEVLYLTMAKVLIDFFNAIEPLPDSEDIKRWYLLCSFTLMLIIGIMNYFIQNFKKNFRSYEKSKSFINGARSVYLDERPKAG